MQPFKPYFPRRAAAALPAADLVPEGSSALWTSRTWAITARHLTFFEMLGNFSFGDYFKQGAVRVRAGALNEGLRLFAGADLGHGLRRGRGARARARRPGDRLLALGGGSGRAHRAARRREDNFWQLGATGPCGPCSELYLEPRPRLRRGGRPAGRRHRALPRVLESRVHAVRPPRGRLADRAAEAEHRHRPRARSPGGDPPGRAVGLRDRPLPAADRARGGAVGAQLRGRTSPPPVRCGSSPTTAAA